MGRRKRRQEFRRRSRPGASPGTLVADPGAPKPVLRVMSYGPDGVVERAIQTVAEARELVGRQAVTWLDVQGLGDADVVAAVGAAFGLHPLWLEDVLNVHQRPKVEHYGEARFLVLRALTGEAGPGTEQISLFFGAKFVVTFQERLGDGFDAVRERIRSGRGRVRAAGADYLSYALLDATIDGYFPHLERLGERIEGLEDDLVERPGSWCLGEIHAVRRELLVLRRAVWPLREAVHHLQRDEDPLIQAETRVYLGDSYDHTVQIMDLVESYREIASGLLDVYLSSMSHRMNEVIKVLTVISTIFIPLTFVAGVYGMNFSPDAGPWSMPELRAPWGYVTCLAVMAAITVALLFWFRRKGWILSGPESRHGLRSDAARPDGERPGG